MIKSELPLPQPFSLGLTLLCGQCFRWEGPDALGWFQGVAGQVFWRLRQEGDRLHWECSSPIVRSRPAGDWLSSYLNLNDNLDNWLSSLDSDFIMRDPIRVLKGLRLVRQEPWECTISYMFAQGLSVKVIRHALGKFCARYGPIIEGAPHDYHAFPEPSPLAALSPDSL